MFCDVCNFPGQCIRIPSPPKGSFNIVAGNGTSVGTVMTLECFPRYRAISGGLISCVQGSNGTQWNGGTPECKGETYINLNTVRFFYLDIHETTAIDVPMIIRKSINYKGNNSHLRKMHCLF